MRARAAVHLSGIEPALAPPPALPMSLSWLVALPLIALLTPAVILVAGLLLFILPALIGLHVLLLPISLIFMAPALSRQPYIPSIDDAMRTRERLQTQHASALLAKSLRCRSFARTCGAASIRSA